MRIHTRLDRATIEGAARLAGAGFIRLGTFRSRSADHGYDVILSGSGRHGGQYGTTDGRSATWDEWGIFLAALYRRDPSAKAGPYVNGEHFEWSTGGRYDALTPAEQHARHRWEYSGETVTGAYRVEECTCGAVRRAVAVGRTWATISGDYGAPVNVGPTAAELAVMAAQAREARERAAVVGRDTSHCASSQLFPTDLPAAEPFVPRRRRATVDA